MATTTIREMSPEEAEAVACLYELRADVVRAGIPDWGQHIKGMVRELIKQRDEARRKAAASWRVLDMDWPAGSVEQRYYVELARDGDKALRGMFTPGTEPDHGPFYDCQPLTTAAKETP